MDQPYLQADPSTSLDCTDAYREQGFETLSSLIQCSIGHSIVLPPAILKSMAMGVMLDLAENGWEFHHDNWPGFTHSSEDDDG